MGYGFAGFIGIAKETVWGTPVAATDYIEALSENFGPVRERFEVKNIVGRYAEPDDEAGLIRVQGDMTFPVNPIGIGYFLRSAFGVMSGSVVLSGSLFKNIFTGATTEFAADSPQPPYTLEVFRDVTSSFRFAGGNVNMLSLTVQPNQDLRATANMIFKTSSIIAKSSPTFPGSPLSPFTYDSCSISIGGAASTLVETLTMTVIDNQLEGIAALNASNEIIKIRRKGPQLVRLSGSIGFDNLTEFNNFITQTEQRFFMNFTKAASFNLLIDMPRVVYTAFPVGMGGRERLVASFEGTARFHTGSNQAIQVDLTNTKSNY